MMVTVVGGAVRGGKSSFVRQMALEHMGQGERVLIVVDNYNQQRQMATELQRLRPMTHWSRATFSMEDRLANGSVSVVNGDSDADRVRGSRFHLALADNLHWRDWLHHYMMWEIAEQWMLFGDVGEHYFEYISRFARNWRSGEQWTYRLLTRIV